MRVKKLNIYIICFIIDTHKLNKYVRDAIFKKLNIELSLINS